MSGKVKICIIGAGAAGLCAAKNVAEHGMHPVVYEQSGSIGGTWVYTEKTTDDASGNEMCNSLYEGLRSNLPKEVMGFPDYLYPTHVFDSYIGAQDIWNFLRSYTKHFRLMQYIKLMHYVVRVRPVRSEWEVIVKDLKNNCLETHYFDFVLVCNGHYTVPAQPTIENSEGFKGLQIHSRSFRKAKEFEGILNDIRKMFVPWHAISFIDQDVLIIGAASSGLDIAMHIHKTARSLILSHHRKTPPNTSFMQSLIQKPDLIRFTEDGGIFADGSSAKFDCVIYCTGYKYSFPFLSVDSGIYVEDNHVQPLYKHCINIAHPTMALIGLPFQVCPTQLFDIQLRFVLKYYSGQKSLPSRYEMKADAKLDMDKRSGRGLEKREAHLMGKEQFSYYKDLSETAGIENIKPVVQKIVESCGDAKYTTELETFRNANFRIVNDNEFVKLN